MYRGNRITFAKLNRRWLFIVFAVAALAAVACGDSATATPRPTATTAPAFTPVPATATPIADGAEALTAEEVEYIEQVRAGWRNFHDKAEGFRAVFGQVYSMKSRLFEALHDSGAGTAFIDALRSIEEMIPPARFQEDHQIMVQTLTDLVAIDSDVGAAVENQDLAAFAIANARLTESVLLLLSRLDPRVCGATEAGDLPFELRDSFRETVPGGDYGAQVYDTMTRFFAGAFSRLIRFGPEYEVEDILATLSVIQPELVQLYSESRGEFEGLQPPDEFAPDHDLLVKYFEDGLAVERSRSTAVAAQDVETYQTLSGEAVALFCDARQQLGAGELRDVVRVALLDPIGLCGGSDY